MRWFFVLLLAAKFGEMRIIVRREIEEVLTLRKKRLGYGYICLN